MIKDLEPLDVSAKRISEVLGEMMQIGAFGGLHIIRGYLETSANRQVLSILGDAAVARCTEEVIQRKWCLTPEGCHRMSPLQSFHKSFRIFDIQPGLALEDRTTYELKQLLDRQGWTCQEYLPPSAKKKKAPALPIGSTAGAPKVWCSTTGQVSLPYLR